MIVLVEMTRKSAVAAIGVQEVNLGAETETAYLLLGCAITQMTVKIIVTSWTVV